MANKIKRVPLPLHISKLSSTTRANDGLLQTSPNSLPTRSQVGSSSSRNPTSSPSSQPSSLSKASGTRNRDVVDRRVKRFTFGPSIHGQSNATVIQDDRRRNSTVGFFKDYQSPSNGESKLLAAPQGSSPRAWGKRRQSDSLQAPSLGSRHISFFKGSSSSSIPVTTSIPHQSQQHISPATKGNLKQKLSRVMRSSSVKKKSPVENTLANELAKRISLDGERHSSRVRTSAETLDVLRPYPRETESLTHAMRASSWGSPRDPDEHIDDDSRSSLDPLKSETNGQSNAIAGIQDFNKSVVRFGAGGYVDSPPSGNSNEFLSDNSQNISPNSDSSISSESTTRQSHNEPHHHPPRVTSPLARPYAIGSEDEDYSSEVFEDTGPEDEDLSDEDMIQVKTRRPSTVLHRSANTSPLY